MKANDGEFDEEDLEDADMTIPAMYVEKEDEDEDPAILTRHVE